MWQERLLVAARRARRGLSRVLVPPADGAQRNVYYLYTEVVFAAVLSAAASFNSAFILRLGGSNVLVGLLSSLPALIAVFTYLPSARILEKRVDRMRPVVSTLLLARLPYVSLVLLPLLATRYVPEIIVAVLVLGQVPAVFFSTGWSPLLSELIPMRSRGTVLAWRSILSSATIAALIFAAGRLLEVVTFPVNYQVLYAVGAIGGGVSVWLVSRIQPERSEAPVPVDRSQGERGSWLGALRTTALRERGFSRLVLNTLLYNLSAWMIGPLVTIYFVRELGASDGWLGTRGTLAHLGVIGGYWVWRYVVRRFGDARILRILAPLMCSYALLLGLIPSLSGILVIELVMNFVGSGVSLSHSMTFLELLPEGKKYSATAVYSMIMNVGAFAAPLLGVALSERIGIRTTLLIAAGMRMLGGLLFTIFPVETVGDQRTTGVTVPHP